MINKLAIFFLLLFVASCSTIHDSRLSGVFISDKDATLKYLKDTGRYTPEHLERIGKLLGKMKVTFNKDNSAVVELEGGISREKFKILEVASDRTVIEYNQCDRYEIIYEEDGFWEVGGIMPLPYMEKFKKIAR